MSTSRRRRATQLIVMVATLITCSCATTDPSRSDPGAGRPSPPPDLGAASAAPTSSIALPVVYGQQSLPLPAGTVGTVIEDTPQIWRLIITGVDPATALDFYDQALASVGFTIDVIDNRPVGFSAENSNGQTAVIVASPDGTLITLRPAGN